MIVFRLNPLFILALMACGDAETVATESSPAQSVSEPSDAPPAHLSAVMAYDQLVTELNHNLSKAHGGGEVARDETLMALVQEHLNAMNQESFRQILRSKHASYRAVLDMVRTLELPEVVAAIPMRKSMYTPSLQSETCGAGVWQLEPDTTVTLGLKLAECELSTGARWSPKDAEADGRSVRIVNAASETRPGSCLIQSCGVDERLDLEDASKAVLNDIRAHYQKESVQKSGTAVQTVLARYSEELPLPPTPSEPPAHTSTDAASGTGAPVPPMTPRAPKEGDFEASVIAIHLLARCVFGHESMDDIASFGAYRGTMPIATVPS